MTEPKVPENISLAIRRFCATSVIPEDVAHGREFIESVGIAMYWVGVNTEREGKNAGVSRGDAILSTFTAISKVETP